MKMEKLIEKYKDHTKDTGSPAVQIILLTGQVEELVHHLKKHPKDYDSRRGLLKMINKRRKLLNYLAKTESSKYKKLISDLKLRK